MASELRRPLASGFILAITLWMLAGIAVAVAFMTLWALAQVEQARVGNESVQDEIAVVSTRDTLLYLAATRELTIAGLPTTPMSDEMLALRRLDDLGGMIKTPIGGELRLDGSVYRGVGGARFAIQDEAGLYSMVLPGQRSLEHFLRTRSVPAEKVPRLRDALLDYIDADDLVRLNGAERREYERNHRPPPPNRRLLTPGEIVRVAGWDELPPEVLERLPEEITTFYSGAANLNTMPASLLPAWLPGCPEVCERVVQARREVPFRSVHDLQGRMGIVLPDGDEYRFLGDEYLRLTLWGRTGTAWRMHVRLTPLADQRGPWSILAAYPITRPSLDEPADETGSALFADPATDRG